MSRAALPIKRNIRRAKGSAAASLLRDCQVGSEENPPMKTTIYWYILVRYGTDYNNLQHMTSSTNCRNNPQLRWHGGSSSEAHSAAWPPALGPSVIAIPMVLNRSQQLVRSWTGLERTHLLARIKSQELSTRISELESKNFVHDRDGSSDIVVLLFLRALILIWYTFSVVFLFAFSYHQVVLIHNYPTHSRQVSLLVAGCWWPWLCQGGHQFASEIGRVYGWEVPRGDDFHSEVLKSIVVN